MANLTGNKVETVEEYIDRPMELYTFAVFDGVANRHIGATVRLTGRRSWIPDGHEYEYETVVEGKRVWLRTQCLKDVLCEACVAIFGEDNAQVATESVESVLMPGGVRALCAEHAVERG